jgi:hypothetical protein
MLSAPFEKSYFIGLPMNMKKPTFTLEMIFISLKATTGLECFFSKPMLEVLSFLYFYYHRITERDSP